ncbi:MAG: diacylglycerol/lipid kinase family protein [Myxococcota bacterium]
MPGIAVVTNPRSRRNLRDPRLAGQLAYVLGSKGEVAQPKDREELTDTCRRFRDAGVDVLAVNGGDGTTHTILTALMQVWGDAPLPSVALLRGGTMNTVATGIGIRGSPAELLGRLVAQYHAGEPIGFVERNLLRVSGDVPQYGFLFGNGLISNYLEVYYEGSEPSPAKAALVLAKGILSALVGGELIQRLTRRAEVEVVAGGETWPWRSYLTVAAGTADNIGLGFKPFFRASSHPGHMHALGIACSARDFILDLPRVRLGKPFTAPDVGQAVVDRLILRGDRPLPYMVDGDFHVGGQSLEVTVGPRLRLLLP